MSKFFAKGFPDLQNIPNLAESYPGMDPLTYYTYMVIRKVFCDFDNTLESFFAPQGLSVGRFTLLSLLRFYPQGLMPSELADQCGVTQATISGLLTGLEKSGFIQREAHQNDGRSYVIKLTDPGREMMQNVCPSFLGCLDKLFKNFSNEEKDTLNQLLKKFSQELAETKSCALPSTKVK